MDNSSSVKSEIELKASSNESIINTPDTERSKDEFDSNPAEPVSKDDNEKIGTTSINPNTGHDTNEKGPCNESKSSSSNSEIKCDASLSNEEKENVDNENIVPDVTDETSEKENQNEYFERVCTEDNSKCGDEGNATKESESFIAPSEKELLIVSNKGSGILPTELDKDRPGIQTDSLLQSEKEEYLDIDAEIDDALDEGYMGMECTLERGFSLNESSIKKNLRLEKYEDISIDYVKKKFPYKYSNSVKHFIPIRKAPKDKEKLKLDKAGLFSFFTFGWITGLMWKAYKVSLTEDDIPLCSEQEMCNPNTQRLSLYWEEEVKKKGLQNATLHTPVWRFVKTRIIISVILLICSLIFGFAGPTIFMRYLIEWLSSDEPVTVGVTWAAGLVLCEAMRILLFAVVWAINYRTALRLRAACLGLVYKKLMNMCDLGNKSVGEVINLFANDAQRIFDFISLGTFFIGGPLLAIAGAAYIMLLLSPWALFGLASLIIFYPIQYLISRLTGYLRRKTVAVTDRRVRMMSEIFHCIKLIKMYAWEKCFDKSIKGIRDEERKFLEKSAYVQSVSYALVPTVPVLASIITFLSHVGAGYNLSPAQAFSIVAVLLRNVRSSLALMRLSINATAEFWVTQKRIQGILCLREIEKYVERGSKGDTIIQVKDAAFAWNVAEETVNKTSTSKGEASLHTEKDSDQRKELLPDAPEKESWIEVVSDVNIEVKKGELIGICGSVGAGKSSLLLGLLGQMSLKKGTVSVGGDCAYVGQEAWIVNGTLRDNILLGEEFDAKRYYKVMYACSLTEDVAVLDGGDHTEIGERGVNLSGGQKQRVSLARALYSNKDIYYLDDCLSSVDAHVGQHIFQWVFRTALRDKTVIFVTHQLQYLPECHRVIYLTKGRIAAFASHQNLMAEEGSYAHLFKMHLETITKQKMESRKSGTNRGDSFSKPFSLSSNHTSENHINDDAASIQEKGGELTSPEQQERGGIPLSVYRKYISLCGGNAVAALVISTFVFNAVASGFSSWWLSVWLKAGSGNTTVIIGNETFISDNIGDNPDIDYYRTIYGLSTVFILVSSLIRGFAFMKTTIKASSRLHSAVFDKVFRSPMSFFESTPSGRVINIFSRDMDEIDVRLPANMEVFLQNAWLIIIALLLVCLVFPFFLIFLFFLMALFLFVRNIFKHGIRDLKRFENTSRSPMFTIISTTVNGLPSIQAYHKQSMFTQRFMRLFDENSTCFFMFNCGMRWLAIRLDFLALTVTATTALFCVCFRSSVGAASAGLALAYATQLSGIFQYTVRMSTETEARFTSVQRLLTYIETLTSEAPSIVKGNRPNQNWPKFGRVSFRKVELKYRAETPLALKGVSFDIDSQEKIGVVGRTGSGKSSLGAALFRLVELKRGSIFIDGINVASVGLEDLRMRLSIIPQDPVLFIGTVRYNLDPFEKYSDSDIWNALEQAHMKESISGLEQSLFAKVVENGSNFSVGERQLLCMARAILRKSKILFLDEATSGIDTETDRKIQSTLKEAFKDCTMITVAHRLNTIMTCSRVLVMDNGSVAEFDPPEALLKNPSSRFSKLVAASKKGLYSL